MIEWLKIDHMLPDRVTIENHGKLLSIDQVDEDDNGKYMCKATNIHGMAVHYFDVSVEGMCVYLKYMLYSLNCI
jgi:hypothetical protein